MSLQAENDIRAHFTGSMQDITPALARHEARVLFVPLAGDPAFSSTCSMVLSTHELRRAKRFSNMEQRAEFVQRRAFRRFCAAMAVDSTQPLAALEFEQTENGQPYRSDAAAIRFSFASSGAGMLGAWSQMAGVGVDIEDCNAALDATAMARTFFSSTEAASIEALGAAGRQTVFYRLWTLKEAALKSIGEGLPFGLDAFRFSLEHGARMTNAPTGYGGCRAFAVHELECGGTTAALVVRSEIH